MSGRLHRRTRRKEVCAGLLVAEPGDEGGRTDWSHVDEPEVVGGGEHDDDLAGSCDCARDARGGGSLAESGLVATALPSGLVTFVLTDIEGSTHLFRQLGELYPPLLERHNYLLRDVWAAHRGAEVGTEGDAFLVAFASAADAFAACAAGQRALAAERWPSDASIRVRMGVHTGIAFPRDGDYIALVIHQAARVVAAAVGGQTLATTAANDEAGAVPGVVVESLGAFRLRDFDGPAQLHELHAAELPALGATVVRAMPAEGHNLVPPLTSFVGREDNLAGLQAALEPGRLVTIVGPGGMGKTRLAIEVGLRAAPAWRDGVWMVDLSPLTDPGLVPTAVARSIGLSAGNDDWSAVINHLQQRSAVIILDNCEHLLHACEQAAAELVGRCSDSAVLATSREPLAVRGEVVWRLPPLPLVDASLQLFLERAQTIEPSLVVNDEEREIALDICRQLDGMPLAIELAAARVGVLSLAEIRTGLQQRFRLLKSRASIVPERQRTLRGLLDWSFALLTPEEQLTLRRLAVFAGSFDVASAAAAVHRDDIDDDDVPELVWSLADKSLLAVERTAGSSRYRLLDTVRAYAAMRLDETTDAPSTRLALAEWYLDHFRFERCGNRDWLAAFSVEFDSVTALIEPLLLDDRVDEAHYLTMLAALYEANTGRWRMALELARRVAAHSTRSTPGLARIQILIASLGGAGDPDTDVTAHLDSAAAIIERFGGDDRWGHIPLARGVARYAERVGTADALRNAEKKLRADLEAAPDESDRILSLFMLAGLLNALDDDGGAEMLTQVIERARSIDDDSTLLSALGEMAELELRRGDARASAGLQRDALFLALEIGDHVMTAFSMIIAARISEPQGRGEQAVQLHSAAEALLEEAGFRLLPPDQALSTRMLTAARRRLGADGFASAMAAGRLMELSDAIRMTDTVLQHAAGID
jgi:predicted ATPase